MSKLYRINIFTFTVDYDNAVITSNISYRLFNVQKKSFTEQMLHGQYINYDNKQCYANIHNFYRSITAFKQTFKANGLGAFYITNKTSNKTTYQICIPNASFNKINNSADKLSEGAWSERFKAVEQKFIQSIYNVLVETFKPAIIEKIENMDIIDFLDMIGCEIVSYDDCYGDREVKLIKTGISLKKLYEHLSKILQSANNIHILE